MKEIETLLRRHSELIAENKRLDEAAEYLDALTTLFQELNRLQAIEAAAAGLVDYRNHNTLNFQLEKADTWINEMRNNLERK